MKALHWDGVVNPESIILKYKLILQVIPTFSIYVQKIYNNDLP